MRRAAHRRRGLLLTLGLLEVLCLLAAVLAGLALRTAGYASQVAGLAEDQLRQEDFDDVRRDADTAQRPCRLNALVRPSEAVSVSGTDGRRERLEVAVLEVEGGAEDVARALAVGLRECRTARSGAFGLRYAEVRQAGGSVTWRIDAQGPVSSSGIARFVRVGACSVYLADQRAGAAAVGPERLDRLEGALRDVLRGRGRDDCTD